MRAALSPTGNRRDSGIGGKRSIGIVLAIALAISSLPPTRVSAAQPGAPLTISPSREAGGTTKPVPKEEVVPVFDPDAPPKTRIQLAPFLTFGGKLKLEYVHKNNFDLNDAQDDNLSTLEPELDVAFSFDPSKHFQVFLNLELSKEFELEGEGEDEKRRTKLELSKAFVSFKEMIDGLSLRIGRQRFKDDREWLYDEKLDAVRVFYGLSTLSLELSASRENLFRKDLLNDEEEEERINNYIVDGEYPLTEDAKIGAYVLFRDDRSPEPERPIFFGLRSSGEIIDDLDYWLELAHVRGKDGSTRIRGVGVDIGGTYQFDVPLKPSIAVGYAFGTGDADPDDGTDKSFRQTGFQDNQDKFHGVTRFKYYGELFDPELSNLSIFTAGIGSRPNRKSSIDLVYHYYLQDKASAEIRDSAIDAEPTGLSRRLGSEIDLIVGYEEIRNLNVKLVLGYFIPGSAFPDEADSSLFANFEIKFSF